DSEGKVLASRIVLNKTVPSIFAAETLACVQGLQLGLDLGVMIVEVEGDVLPVIKKLQKKGDDVSEICALIKDCQWLSLGNGEQRDEQRGPDYVEELVERDRQSSV
ncbi:hypothetical protein Goklo_019783, partial [Gossypium klotzschianum]|nr:hypothetical protein [Gossypium klotzschianum]